MSQNYNLPGMNLDLIKRSKTACLVNDCVEIYQFYEKEKPTNGK